VPPHVPVSSSDRDRWTRLFRWFAVIGAVYAVAALAAAVIDPRAGGLPARLVTTGQTDPEVLAVFGAVRLCVRDPGKRERIRRWRRIARCTVLRACARRGWHSSGCTWCGVISGFRSGCSAARSDGVP